MWYEILTIVNIAGSAFVIVALLSIIQHYQVGPRMSFYLFWSMAAMLMIIWGQVYTLSVKASSNWVYKIPVMFYWLKTLYFCWMIRFTLIKKN